MLLSRLSGRRFKERPKEAVLESHAFLLRGAYMRPVANGIYSLLPPAVRVVRKIEAIIREEMNAIGGQEIQMPVVLPADLWRASGRYESIGTELARFQDRTGRDMTLGMTHEEAVVHLFRNEVDSYKDLPFMAYQIQTKFRDEPRSRGGLIRVREFTMKDGYSFHRDQSDLDTYYETCGQAYARIFARVGIPEVAMVRSDTGMMGGSVAHEFMLVCESGEDTLVYCPLCRKWENLEVASGTVEGFQEDPRPLDKVHTPGKKTIEDLAAFLKIKPHQTAKAVFYDHDDQGKLVFAVIRGDLEINEAKLARVIRSAPEAAEETRIRSVGAEPGYASILGISTDACRVLMDHSVASSNNLVCGANEVDYHYRNFNPDRDIPGLTTVDIATVREGDRCSTCRSTLEFSCGIEVGNIFQLGTTYSASMGMSYLDENGANHVPLMGCYGIGVGRLMASIIEARHNQFGPLWPVSIAPWQVHICALGIGKDPEVKAQAQRIHDELQEAGIEVLLDDRDERPGVQFADADLLGVPFRIVVGTRGLKNKVVEFVQKAEDKREDVSVDEMVSVVVTRIGQALNQLMSRTL